MRDLDGVYLSCTYVISRAGHGGNTSCLDERMAAAASINVLMANG
jgi:hypothetical protein